MALLPFAAGCAGAHPAPAAPAQCTRPHMAVARAPAIAAAHELPGRWVSTPGATEAERELLTPAAITALNAENASGAWAFRDVLVDEIGSQDKVTQDFADRLAWLRERIASGKYVEETPGDLDGAAMLMGGSVPTDEFRVAHTEVDLRCVPTHAGFYAPPMDKDFDRNQCSRLHIGEVVRVLRRSADGAWTYVHAGHSVGWLAADLLTPALSPEAVRSFREQGPRLVILADGVTTEAGGKLRLGTSLPVSKRLEGGGWLVLAPTAEGLVTTRIAGDALVHEGYLPFSRANVWRLALARLGDPYGWGGRAGGRDCSRLLLDLFAAFGIRLGRHSLAQADAGSETIVVKGLGEEAKRLAIARAGRQGVVLLYMSGHIMLYLGRDEGRDLAVSAISEFLAPCPGEGDTVVRLDRVVVSDLEVGRGTKRTSFIERLDRLAVFGP